MTSQLPHIVYQAATCPQFRAQLLANLDAALAEYDLGQEDRQALKDVLVRFTCEHNAGPGNERQPELKSGWDGGTAFTTAI